MDGTNAGIPTSLTPINKNKVEKFEEQEINEHEDIVLEECPHCHSKELLELPSEVTKDEFDYQIKIIKKRIYFKEYRYTSCNKIVRRNIPVK